ncbi:MAG: acyl carrier protein [Alphaproteobacteria bacterium]|nr:acyl carrier protein [Alphaproteobacteria bacterium]MCW5749941.1 acyl carrier protein [Alphaproteobacteria bacterium]
MTFLNDQTKRRYEITESTNMARDLNLDSLAVMDVLLALEDKFDVSIPINHLAEIQTVSDLARTIIDIKKG